MSWLLFAAVATITIASRVLPMAFVPVPRGGVVRPLAALPAPLFAGLAVLGLLGDGGLPPVSSWCAVGGALPGALRRSLLLTVAGGVLGHVVGIQIAG